MVPAMVPRSSCAKCRDHSCSSGLSFARTSASTSAATPPITTVTDAAIPPGGGNPDATGRLLSRRGGSATVDGRLEVIGTVGQEHVNVLRGDVALDASFNRGSNTLHLPAAASAYSAQLVGSIVVLISVDSEIATPLSSAGLTLDFDGDARLLQYALAMSNVMIHDQVISSSNMVLID